MERYLDTWASDDVRRGEVAAILKRLARASSNIGDRLRNPGCDLEPDRCFAEATAEFEAALHRSAHAVFEDALTAHVSCDSHDIAAVIQPLTNLRSLESNAPIGSTFTLTPIRKDRSSARIDTQGRHQLAAGIVSYGARTTMALTVGDGTRIFDLAPIQGAFIDSGRRCVIPPRTARYAFNASNREKWHPAIRDYIDQCRSGIDQPDASKFEVHWTDCLVLEAFEVLMHGGLCMVPGSSLEGDTAGCVRLVEEANPIAWLVENAEGLATDGMQPILDLPPTPTKRWTPFFFGAREEKTRVERFYRVPSALGANSPLFGGRGFFRR